MITLSGLITAVGDKQARFQMLSESLVGNQRMSKGVVHVTFGTNEVTLADLCGLSQESDSKIGMVVWLPREAVNKAMAAAKSNSRPNKLSLDTPTQVFFYEQDFYVLSNFSAFNVVVFSQVFWTAEHAYHYRKFSDTDGIIASQIMAAGSAHDAFKIAEANKAHRRRDWDDVKVRIMREILRAKVDQHEYVRRKLIDTGDRELIENSWRDSFWGWGENRDGQNQLGKLWMEIRAELRPK